jgi:hypothetical protein
MILYLKGEYANMKCIKSCDNLSKVSAPQGTEGLSAPR